MTDWRDDEPDDWQDAENERLTDEQKESYDRAQ